VHLIEVKASMGQCKSEHDRMSLVYASSYCFSGLKGKDGLTSEHLPKKA
jgi:hypothetical protein